jgi:Fur family transcriptional regulator, zinc uptake regulator
MNGKTATERNASWWQRAKQRCASANVRLTDKRIRLLEVLLEADRPLSAYELAAAYTTKYDSDLKPMSVYRMLDALVAAHLIHKLASNNTFMACDGDTHGADEGVQFLICDSCSRVIETPLTKTMSHTMDSSAKRAGFSILHHQVELHGVCGKCIAESSS